jgi:hypothetical protein
MVHDCVHTSPRAHARVCLRVRACVLEHVRVLGHVIEHHHLDAKTSKPQIDVIDASDHDLSLAQ